MSRRTRKLTALISATALLGGTGLGVADAAKTSTTTRTAGAAAPGGGHHRGGLPSADLAKIASALGVTSAQLKSALDANRPAAPAGTADKRGDFAADLASALGVDTAAVQSILDANRPAAPATPPAQGTAPQRPDQSKLIAALASGLGLDQTTVTAALAKLDAARDADHQKRDTALYAALATALNKTAAEVKAAFEANRPAPPTS